MRFFPRVIVFLGRSMVLALGLIVLGISITRASLQILAQELNDSKISNSRLSFIIDYGDGETEVGDYDLPNAGILPTNPMYGLKRVRDYFWLLFSRGLEKGKLALLLADKKAEEVDELYKLNKNTEALAAGNEALDKLEYADQLIRSIKGNDDQVKQLSKQIYLAGFAYKEIFKYGEKAFDIDQVEYRKLTQRNDIWNQKQKEEKWRWEN